MSSNLPFTIEKSTWRDLNNLRRLEQECFPEDMWPLWDLIGVLTFMGIIRLKAVVQSEMVGFIAGEIKFNEKTGWISTLAVTNRYRRQGIGKALLTACEKELGSKRMKLCVRTTNKEAINLYDEMGYNRVDVWHRYYNDNADAFVLEKIIL